MPDLIFKNAITEAEYQALLVDHQEDPGFVSVEEYLLANLRGLVRGSVDRVGAARLTGLGVKTLADLSSEEIEAIVAVREKYKIEVTPSDPKAEAVTVDVKG